MSVCAFDAVIFDLDGVLLDSEPIYLAAPVMRQSGGGRYDRCEAHAGGPLWR